jgi:3-keto-5-aminohexanoate cleavage enzyme
VTDASQQSTQAPGTQAQSTGAWEPVGIMVAPNGARRTKQDHPALPMNATETAHCAAACHAAGAAMIHVHVRDAQGRHALDADLYREATAAIRREVGEGLVIQATTEAVGRYTPAEQMALVRDLRPEAVSMAVRELIPDAGAEREAASFLTWMSRERIAPQFILYSADDLARFDDLRHRGVVPDTFTDILYVLGRYTSGQQSTPRDLVPFLAADGARYPWTVCAFGYREHACALTAAAMGGHIRVGFENNLHLKDGTLAPDNAALVADVAAAVRALGRPLADADAFRRRFAR